MKGAFKSAEVLNKASQTKLFCDKVLNVTVTKTSLRQYNTVTAIKSMSSGNTSTLWITFLFLHVCTIYDNKFDKQKLYLFVSTLPITLYTRLIIIFAPSKQINNIIAEE